MGCSLSNRILLTMKLLVGINGNAEEWQKCLVEDKTQPRLPLPYAMGAAFVLRGHQVSAVDFAASSADSSETPHLFEEIYSPQMQRKALAETDAALFWGGHGVSTALRQFTVFPPRRSALLATYVWKLEKLPTFRARLAGMATRIAALSAKGLVVITSEQQEAAKKFLPSSTLVLKLTCGIDVNFYHEPAIYEEDVPEFYRSQIEGLLSKPYIIMPGDEQRLHDDALDIISNSDLRLVRVSQYHPEKAERFRHQIKERGIADRCFLFQGISYQLLRFLLQNASAYAGLVDATWQPAGWTVACEAIASGLPVVLYEGLVSRELQSLGAGEFLRVVPMGNKHLFQKELEAVVTNGNRMPATRQARVFSLQQLDCERTGDDFVRAVEVSYPK